MPEERAKIIVHGTVQGVGFRPFVYHLALRLGLNGWVLNSVEGVVIEVEGDAESVQRFVRHLKEEKPPRASVQRMEVSYLELAGDNSFEIRDSDFNGSKTAIISPDIATCADCLRELFDAKDRRFRYPFTNCTNCGPRFTIVETLPYDRPRTTMKAFAMCEDCEREYHNPLDRRFHAQPNACPRCGPQLALWDTGGCIVAEGEASLLGAAEQVRNGRILALKGLGGFQLIVDARDEAAVRRLRDRKRREEKPFAVMAPSLDWANENCLIGELEGQLLCSAEAPIVILSRRTGTSMLAIAVAPGSPSLGLMLPYTPLHHLLMEELGFPVVATSGNLSNEPICIAEDEALERLRGIADCYLVHNRPIVRHMDDSVVHVVCDHEQILRRARGYAPLPIRVPHPLPPLLAFGAHQKNAVALSSGTNIFISQHLGDLDSAQAYDAFRKAATDLPDLYDTASALKGVVCDLHPDYLSTQYAKQLATRTSLPVYLTQHHWAHVAACMAENGLEPPALGIAWDGTGLGLDGTIWGGEFLLAESPSLQRFAHWRPFHLPGGEAAVKEPRRSALGILYSVFGNELWSRSDLLTAFSETELTLLPRMFSNGINTPLTSSVGRLFDAVAAISGLRERVSFEGQAAMELEAAARTIEPGFDEAYPFDLRDSSPSVIDWEPMIHAVLSDRQKGIAAGIISAKFHNMLAEVCIAIAQRAGQTNVALTGGCFQNKRLTEQVVRRLIAAGFKPHWHRQVPPNDGGIALGQIVATTWAQR